MISHDLLSLCTLMLAGIKDFLVITNPSDNESFKKLLKDGNQWGKISNINKNQMDWQVFIIGEQFLNKSPAALILGDNLFLVKT